MRVRSFCIAGCLTFSLNCGAESNATTDLEQLISEVASFLQQQYEQSDADIEIQVTRLDSRLRLASCDQPIEFNLRDNGATGGNVSVHTRCPGANPWALYISASIKVMQGVVIANRNIPKGTVLSLQDFDTQLRDTANLANSYVLEASQLIGKVTARNIRAGEALRYAQVSEPIAVKRGDTLMVEAQAGSVVVSTQAVAMADGRIVDQISVRNPQTERIVRVEIMGPGRGRVIL